MTDRTLRNRLRLAGYASFGRLSPRLRRAMVGLLTPSFTVGALAVIYDAEQVLFVRQLHQSGLSLPGGLLKKREPARLALARELREELALDATGFAGTPDTAYVDADRTRVDLVFFRKVDRAAVQPVPGSEVFDFVWRPVDDPELTGQTQEILTAIADRMSR